MSQIARSPASFTEVKNALFGRCQEVAMNVCKIDPVDVSQIVAKRRFIHHCGAKKGRMSNPDAMIGGCDGCKAKWSGPIDFVMQELRVDKYEAKDLLAAYFGIEGASRGGVSSRPRAKTQAIDKNVKAEPIELSEDGYSRHKQILTVSESNESMMLVCAKHKRGVTVDALLQIGAVCAYWQQSEKSKKQYVIAIPVYAGPKLDLVNYILYGPTGKIWVREKSDGGDWIDTHVSKRLAFGQNDEDRKRGVKFDRNGICCSLAVRDAILRGQIIDGARLAKFEGDSDLLVALPLLTLEDSWIAWTNNDGARSTHVFDWLIGLLSPLGIQESIVVHDRDEAGELGAIECAKRLGQLSPTKIVKLPLDYKTKKGPDFRDYVNVPNGKAELLELIANTEVGISDNDSNSYDELGSEERTVKKALAPEVYVTADEAVVAEQVVCNLGLLGWNSPWIPGENQDSLRVYCRGGWLVNITHSEDPGSIGKIGIKNIPLPIVRERITQSSYLIVEDAKGNLKHGHPPTWLLDSVFQRGNFGGYIKPLVGVINSPTIRPDGSILQEPGYDADTGLIYRPSMEYPQIPELPTKDDSKLAIDRLFDVVSDFPFVADADRSAWVALLLSLVGRACVSGCVPLFAITATCAGSGKGLLADVATQIAYGHPVSKRSFQRDDVELSKFISTLLFESEKCHIFDNLSRPLQGDSLDVVLTSTVMKDRLLSKTKSTGEMPARTVWIATGNNITYGGDTGRRVLPIRLDPDTESPEKRDGFSHPNLIDWAKANRATLVCDSLTILRAFFVAKPALKITTWGSFESWLETICASIVFAGGADPTPTRDEANENDDSKELVRMVIDAFDEADPDREGMTVRQIENLIKNYPKTYPALVECSGEICGTIFIPKRFSAKLRSIEGRVVNKKKISKDDAGKNLKRWRVSLVVDENGGTNPKLTNELTQEELQKHSEKTPRVSLVSSLLDSTRREINEVPESCHESSCIRMGDSLNRTNQTNPTNPASNDACPKCGCILDMGIEINGYANFSCMKCNFIEPRFIGG